MSPYLIKFLLKAYLLLKGTKPFKMDHLLQNRPIKSNTWAVRKLMTPTASLGP